MRGLGARGGQQRMNLALNRAGMGYAEHGIMKTHLAFIRRAVVAFTLLELVITVGVLVLIAALLLPALAKSTHTGCRINCANNLKQVGLSFRLWAGDNGEKFPMQVAVTNGGSLESVATGLVAPHFAVISNELGTPKIVACPDDKERKSATDFGLLRDTNVGYFICLSATAESAPDTWLAGDRNITNRFAPTRGVLYLSTNSPVGWSDETHKQQGNLVFIDGSVQQPSSTKLRDYLRSQTNSPLRLAMPE